jgi:hypothetical protein
MRLYCKKNAMAALQTMELHIFHLEMSEGYISVLRLRRKEQAASLRANQNGARHNACAVRSCLPVYLSTLTMSHFKTFTTKSTKGRKGEQMLKTRVSFVLLRALCGLELWFQS